MANMKVVFITSVVFGGTGNGQAGLSYAPTYVYDLVDTVANDYVTKGYAIPFDGWEDNPKRPILIRFPK